MKQPAIEENASPTVLIVDDTPANLGVVAEALERRGYHVLVAQDGEEGLQRAELTRPDLILLDVMMPGIDGFEVCRRLKQLPSTRAIPVIFMTARTGMEDKLSAFQVGAVDYVTKPLQIEEVLARVETQLNLAAMQRRLEAQNAELAAHRDNLERLVAERTAELAAANQTLQLRSYALNQVREAAYLIDQEARFLYVNDESCRALGYSREELLGLTVMDIGVGWTTELWTRTWAEMRVTKTFTGEAMHRRKDGSAFPVEIHASQFEFGGRVYNLALVRDITERKQTEEELDRYREHLEELVQERTAALRESKARMLALIDNLPFEFWAMDRDLRYIMQNAASQKHYGPVVGKRIEDLGLSPEVTSQWREQDLKVLAGEILRAEYEVERGGENRVFESLVAPVAVDGAVVGIVGVGMDITERKRAEDQIRELNAELEQRVRDRTAQLESTNQELRESEQRYREIFDNVSDSLYLLEVTPDGHFRNLAVNPAFEASSGIPRMDLIGKFIEEVVPPEMVAVVAAKYRRCIESGKSSEEEVALDLPSGRRHYHSTLIPVRDDSGHVCRIVGISRDVTDRERAKELLLRQVELDRRLAHFARLAPGFMFTYRQDIQGNGTFLYASPGVEGLCGLPAQRLLEDASLFFSRIPAEEAARIRAAMAEAAGAGKTCVVEYRSEHRQQGEQWLELRATPEPDEGSGTLWHGHIVDITARRAMERENALLRAMADNAVDPLIFTHSLDAAAGLPLLYTNPAFARHLGRSAEEMHGLRVADFMDYKAEDLATHMAALRARKSLRFEAEHIRKNGGRVPVEVTLTYLEHNGDELAAGYCMDISQRKEAERRLHASEQAFRAVVERSPDTIVRYDRDCRRIYLNPAMLRQVGRPEAEWLGKTPYEDSLTHDETSQAGRLRKVDLLAQVERIRYVFETGTGTTHETIVQNAAGEARWNQLRFVPEFGPDGTVVSVLAIGRDIHELKKSERRFRTLAENFPDFLMRFDREYRNLYVNPALVKATGIPAADFLGKRLGELELPGQSAQGDDVETGLRRTFATGEVTEYELSWRIGEVEHLFEIRNIPERDASGNVVSVLGIARDMTRLRAVERALRASEQEFRTLAENAPDIIMRYDLDCRRLYVNPAYERETGTPASVALHTPSDAQWRSPSMTVDEYKAILRRVMETGELADTVIGWPARDGAGQEAVSYYAVRLVAERDTDGRITGALAMGHNITDLKQAERRLEESRRQLREMSALRENARDEERKLIAHEIHDELGQVLTAMKLGVSTVRMQFAHDNPPLDDRLRNLLGLADRSIQVVRNVAYSLRPAALDVGVVPALEWLASEFTSHAGIPCHVEAPDEKLALGEAQAMVLFRVVQEGLTNIARYAVASRVDLALTCGPDCCTLELRDDGKGFDPAAVGRKSFGLLGMRERVERIGGKVTIDSAPGKGTRVWVSLPCGKATAEKASPQAAALQGGQPS